MPPRWCTWSSSTTSRDLKLTVAYDGTDFAGWAVQPGLRTVCGEMARALEVPASQLVVAGRTDRGVHAAGNVVSVRLPRLLPAQAITSWLPPDVSVTRVEEAPAGFNARGDATSRSYVYRINNGRIPDPLQRRFELFHPYRVDFDALCESAAELVGTHDFTAFTPSETKHRHFRRTVYQAEWRREGDRLEFHITADAFLRHMVRVIVGTMLEARPDPVRFRRLAAGAARSEAGRTALPHGLTLLQVSYA